MAACYADDATFHDPAFGALSAAQVRAMWKMLVGRSNDLRVKFNVIEETDTKGVCEWQASYTFTSTGRKVRNSIRSELVLRDGLILRQRDHFNFWRWSRQALGATGWLLGWSPLLRNKVRSSARAALERVMR